MRTIKKDTLLGLIYNYWYRKAGKVLSESGLAAENLCHFCRVIIGWTFVRWFFCARTLKVVMPWLVALIVGFVTVFYLWPEEMKLALWYTLIGTGCFAGIIGFIISIIYACIKLDPNGDQSKKFLRRKVVGRLPVWFFMLSLLLAAGLHFAFEVTVALVAIVAIYGAFGLLIVIIVGLPPNTPEKIMKIIPLSLREMLGVAWEYLKAKKQKYLCPLLQVELDERNRK